MVVFTGKTVEEATRQAVTSLGVPVEDLSIRVVEMGRKGFLGFGRKLAKIDVTLIPREEPASEQNMEQAVVTDEGDRSFEQFVSESFGQDITPITKEDLEDARDALITYLSDILDQMSLDVAISADIKDKELFIQMDTKEPGRLIGYHGKILKALQVLVQNFLHDRHSKDFSVTLNVADYIERRYEVLETLARKAANKVLETGRDYILDPMPNNERKQMHKVLSQIAGVDSYSAGADGRRRVVITVEKSLN